MRRLAFSLLAITLSGCHGNASAAEPGLIERRFPVAGPVHAVDLRGSDDVRVVHGAPLSVVASGPREVLDRLDIHTREGRLIVDRHGPYVSTRGAVVTVTLPAIDAAAVDGSGDIAIDRANGPRFAGAIGGSGDMTIGSLAVGTAAFDLSGSGDLKAAGRVQSLTVSVSGSGDAALHGLSMDRATLALNGSGDIDTGPAASVTGSASGSGSITVAGHPRCTIAKRGSADVSCG